jgi:hypothetical protein
VFLKRCDSCTIIFKMRAGGASSRPVEEAWNKEVGCNHNKLAYIYIYISKDFKDEVMFDGSYVSVKHDLFSSFAMRKWELAVWRS